MEYNTSSSSSREVNWLDLPSHLLSFISDKLLLNIKDYIRFGVVCHPWRSVYVGNRHRPLPRQLPMLLLGSELINGDPNKRFLYDLSEKRVYGFSLPHDVECRSSTEGWLLTGDKKSGFCLLNPFMLVNNKIELPHLPNFEVRGIDDDRFFVKAVLSSNPASSSNYVVMAIYSILRTLAFYKRGDSAWTCLEYECSQIQDVIYCRDQFYAVDWYGRVWACDVNSPPNKVSNITPPLDEDNLWISYIVESSGDLLCVRKKRIWIRDNCYSTVGFKVFKLDAAKCKWFAIRNLGGQTLFLGDNTSVSLLASNYPGFRPNCIYFTEEFCLYRESDGRYDMGVFNMEDRSIEEYRATEAKRIFTAPIWIEPSLNVSSSDLFQSITILET